nr:Ig-like domain-containing protein [Methanobrevibacter smithii]
MKNRKIILILILGLFFIALSNVNAEDNSTVTLNHSNTEDIGISEADSTIDTDESNQNSADIVKIKDYNQKYTSIDNTNKVGENVYIGSKYPSIENTITVNDTSEFNKTGNITVNIHVTGKFTMGEKEFNKTYLIIYENNTIISQKTLNELNLPPYQHFTTPGNYTFDISFPYHVQDKSRLQVYIFGIFSNTIVFEKLNKIQLTNLTNNNIIIDNKIKSNNNWTNSINSIKKALDLVENEGTIYLSNLNIIHDQNENILINKSVTIIGNNVTFNGFEKESLFNITNNAKVTFVNLTITNTTSYSINTEGKVNLINCTFKNILGRAINNTGILELLNITFTTDSIYQHPKITNLKSNLNNSLIYNKGLLKIENCTFKQISLQNQIITNKNNITWDSIIYNAENANLTINNSKFTNIENRVIKNNGRLIIVNSSFENKTKIHINIIINDTYQELSNNYIYQTYREKAIKTINGSIIYNSNLLTIENSSFKNITDIINNIDYIGIKPASTDFFGTTGWFGSNGGAIYNTGTFQIKSSSFNNVKSKTGGAIYNIGFGTIENSTFNHINSTSGTGGTIYNTGQLIITTTTISNSKSSSNGGAIYSEGNLNISNTSISLSEGYHGGAIYNTGNIYLWNSLINKTKSTYNGNAIQNSGNMHLNNTIISNINGYNSIYNDESGTGIIINSIIKNNKIYSKNGYNTKVYYGSIENLGTLTINRTIFNNNSYGDNNFYYLTGAFNIYNKGTINAFYNMFINTKHLQATSPAPYIIPKDPYAFLFNEGTINMDYNYFCTNANPYPKDSNSEIDNYFIFTFKPEYGSLQIGDTIQLKVDLKLANGKLFTDYNLLPEMNVTFTTIIDGKEVNITKPLINGTASLDYNYTSQKGQYKVYANLGGHAEEIILDVGKEDSKIDVDLNNNIIYGEDAIFKINVNGNYTHIPTGNVTVIINDKKYSINLVNGSTNLTVSDLTPGNYTIKIIYEGDSDYAKFFYYCNYTVNKHPTTLNITAPEVKIGQNGELIINLEPKGSQTQGYLYINGELKQIIYIYAGKTTIPLKNFAVGEYNLTVVLWDSKYYESSNASTIFKVSKFDTNLTINVDDVKSGEDATATITVNPDNLRGEAILCVNGVNTTIFLKSEVTNITMHNLTSGSYNVTVYYLGDSKYAPSNATTTFKVLRDSCNLTVNITYNDDLTGIITVKTNPNTCTGEIGAYINNEFYKLNLTNGTAVFNVNFTKGSNYIYVLYLGDKQFESASWNTTLNITSIDFILSGENLTIKEQDNSLYHFNLTDTDGTPYVYAKVEINIDNKNYTVMTNSKGLGYLNLNLKAGEYILKATFNGFTVENKIIVKPADLNIDIKDILAGETEVITANLPANATGNITFIVDGKTYNKTLKNGAASVEIANLGLGKHSLKVIYSGDSNYINNTKEVEFNIKNSLSSITINSIKDGIYGESITITANITRGADGNVTFTIDSDSKTVEIVNGVAKVTFNKVNAGDKTVKATYNGNNIYQGSSDSKEFKIAKAPSNISIITSEIVEGQNVRIWAIVNDDATGNVTFRILGLYSPRNKTISNGNASWLISPLTSGSYTINAYYNGDNNYLSSNTTTVISLNQTVSVLKVNVEVYEEDMVVTAILKTQDGQLITGNVTLEINTKFYKIVVVDGIGVRSIEKPSVGKYTYSATYKGTDKISRAVDTGVFEVLPVDYNVILNAPDVKMIYHDGTRFTATLTDKKGNPIRDAAIEITINGRSYDKITDEKGSVSLGLNLDSGIYSVVVKFKGLLNYTPITKHANVTIEPTVKGLDVVKMFRNNTQYYAIFTDSQGNFLKNKNIQFNINGVFYTRTTNDKGIAMMNINLNPGKYVITSKNLVTGEQSGNNITVKSLIVQKDLTKHYLNASKFQTTIYNKDGSLAVNKEVTFNINGVLYTRKTDSKGAASLAINLRPGEYIITTMFDGLSIGNKVKVLPTLVTHDLNMKYMDGSRFTAQTLDGQGKPLANQNVSFNVNGVFYHRITDNKGIAKLNIRLMAGEYIITSSWNNFQTGNTIRIF